MDNSTASAWFKKDDRRPTRRQTDELPMQRIGPHRMLTVPLGVLVNFRRVEEKVV
jgi:hypothetical protein